MNEITSDAEKLSPEEKALEYLEEARLMGLENRFANEPVYLKKLARRIENIFIQHPNIIDDVGVEKATEDGFEVTKDLRIRETYTSAYDYGEIIIWRDILTFMKTGDQADANETTPLTDDQREDANVLIAIFLVITTRLWPYQQTWEDVVAGKKAEEERRYDSAVKSIDFNTDKQD